MSVSVLWPEGSRALVNESRSCRQIYRTANAWSKNALLRKRKIWVLFAEGDIDTRPAKTVFIYYSS